MSITLSSQVSTGHIRNVLYKNTDLYQQSLEQLSTGVKFLHTGDDPIAATQSIALTTQISATAQSLSNIGIGGDMLNIAADGQQQVISSLQRIRDLCMEAANETYSATDKDSILAEIRQRLSAIDDIADNTTFNGHNLLDGSCGSTSANPLTLQTGANSSSRLDVSSALINVHVSQLGTGANIDLRIGAGVNGTNWTTTAIEAYVDKIDSAIPQLINASAETGSYINNLKRCSSGLDSMTNDMIASRSVIADTDVAQVSADMIKFQILQEASVSILTQANQMKQLTYSLIQ